MNNWFVWFLYMHVSVEREYLCVYVVRHLCRDEAGLGCWRWLRWWHHWLMIPFPPHQGRDHLSSARNDKSRVTLCALHRSFFVLVLLYIYFFNMLPCPASCWAGRQPSDRYLSPDQTLCSRTEPAAPPKKAQQPAGSNRRIEGTHVWKKWITGITDTLMLELHQSLAANL